MVQGTWINNWTVVLKGILQHVYITVIYVDRALMDTNAFRHRNIPCVYGVLNGEAFVEDGFITGYSINNMRLKLNNRYIGENI